MGNLRGRLSIEPIRFRGRPGLTRGTARTLAWASRPRHGFGRHPRTLRSPRCGIRLLTSDVCGSDNRRRPSVRDSVAVRLGKAREAYRRRPDSTGGRQVAYWRDSPSPFTDRRFSRGTVRSSVTSDPGQSVEKRRETCACTILTARILFKPNRSRARDLSSARCAPPCRAAFSRQICSALRPPVSDPDGSRSSSPARAIHQDRAHHRQALRLQSTRQHRWHNCDGRSAVKRQNIRVLRPHAENRRQSLA